ncbi:restriction endonuclease subunit S [Streptococcus thermophilus]|nr:restriction endonuclease subunit S [Streptococcus thermophilus]MCE2230289.1 restriction endonuclease subunit S [Streptococcus thermophilus]MCE2233207.1 restriction endonuclease subunit S [Streptococcus thermophilus]MCE2235115.1 restriction endonuclease subunit S [Streptococcus thermophilus]MCE2238025.1 restriction endonuclease subunit S [Streptococcus thermophilus]
MSEWKKKQLQEIAILKPTETLKKGDIAPNIPMANIKEFQRDVVKIDYGEFRGGTKFRNGDTLLAKITPCLENGKTAFVNCLQEDEIGFGSTEFIVLRAKENIDERFLYYLSISPEFRKQAISLMEGTSGRKRVNENALKISDFLIPDFEEQKKIANILSAIDDKISLNNQINQELEAMAKTLYDYWFVQFNFPDQNGKPYKSSGGKMVYNPELKREIPEGWGVEKLGDITICHDSKRVPLSRHEREHVKGEIPYYGATGIMDYVNDYIFDGDYVLMAEDGSVMTEKGTPILQRISGKNWVNNHAHVIEPVKNHSCKLLMMLLKDVSVMKIKTGSIQMKINQENMNKIVVPAIPLELLFEINQRLEVIDKQQLNLIEENKQLTQLRDWILPMLMNGQVKVE